MDNGKRAMAGGAQGADAHLLSAERHLQAKQFEDAVRELTAALEDAPKDWPRHADALTSLISAQRKNKNIAGCLELGEKALAGDELSTTTASASDFLVDVTGCADEWLKDTKPGLAAGDKNAEPRIKALREKAIAAWQKLLDNPAAKLSVDDRSDAMATLREVLDALERHDEAHAVAEQQRALLDDTAAKAKTPLEAMTYNWPRAEVYNYLGKPLELVAALEKSAKDLPGEYDPRARLGWIYLRAGKLAEAAKWTDEALPMVYGPRKARVLATRAEIAKQEGDKTKERAMREAVVALWQAMPAGQADPDALKNAQLIVSKL
jgi:tetratricopeptide (TPR) repeat protein